MSGTPHHLFERKHFAALAEFAALHMPTQAKLDLATFLASTNPSFDRQKFLSEAGVIHPVTHSERVAARAEANRPWDGKASTALKL